jgi:hypothetical protein
LKLFVTLVLVGLLAGGCSPEASRQRSAGAGADVGNHSRELPEPSTAPKPEQRP